MALLFGRQVVLNGFYLHPKFHHVFLLLSRDMATQSCNIKMYVKSALTTLSGHTVTQTHGHTVTPTHGRNDEMGLDEMGRHHIHSKG